jgi:uncharacterized protein
MNLPGAKEYIIKRLKTDLNPALYYHSVEHTLDVYKAVCMLNKRENLIGEPGIIAETAALFHDSGMVNQYVNHEESSVEIVREILPQFGYTWQEIDEISKLIMVTKLPQGPTTLSEKILCDADLDYLGREDYFIHAFKLRVEWNVNQIKRTTLREWFEIQVQFLGNHKYFTPSAIYLRNDQKRRNLEEITQFLNHS